MKKKITLFGITFISGLLSACGGGGSSSDSPSSVTTPPNVPNDTISPELSDEFVPFKDQPILDR